MEKEREIIYDALKNLPLDLKDIDCRVIAFLVHREPVQLAHLEAYLSRSQPTISKSVNRLEEKGYVTRQVDEDTKPGKGAPRHQVELKENWYDRVHNKVQETREDITFYKQRLQERVNKIGRERGSESVHI